MATKITDHFGQLIMEEGIGDLTLQCGKCETIHEDDTKIEIKENNAICGICTTKLIEIS